MLEFSINLSDRLSYRSYKNNYTLVDVDVDIPDVDIPRRTLPGDNKNVGVDLMDEFRSHIIVDYLHNNPMLFSKKVLRVVWINALGTKRTIVGNNIQRAGSNTFKYIFPIYDYSDIFHPHMKVINDCIKMKNELEPDPIYNFYSSISEYTLSKNNDEYVFCIIYNHNLDLEQWNLIERILTSCDRIVSFNITPSNIKLYGYFEELEVTKYMNSAIFHEHKRLRKYVDNSHAVKNVLHLIKSMLRYDRPTEHLYFKFILNYFLQDSSVRINNEHLKYIIYSNINDCAKVSLDNVKYVLGYNDNYYQQGNMLQNNFDYMSTKITGSLSIRRENDPMRGFKNKSKEDQIEIKKFVKKRYGIMPNSSFIKLMIILYDIGLNLSNTINSLHLCEAPGYWIKCVEIYKKDNYNQSYDDWKAVTLPEGFEVLKLFDKKRWILEDITTISPQTLGKSNFITSDLGIPDVSFRPEDKLLPANLAVLNIIDKQLLLGGNAIIKYFLPASNEEILRIIYKLVNEFTTTIYHKPNVNIHSSEFYIIFLDRSSRDPKISYEYFLQCHNRTITALLDRYKLAFVLYSKSNDADAEVRKKYLLDSYMQVTTPHTK